MASLVVGSLTLIAEHTSNSLISDVLFLPLATGLLTELLITGWTWRFDY